MQQQTLDLRCILATMKKGSWTQRTLDTSLEEFTDWGQREPVRTLLRQHTYTCQRPHDASKRRRLNAGRLRQLLSAFGFIGDQIGDSQRRRHMDRLRNALDEN